MLPILLHSIPNRLGAWPVCARAMLIFIGTLTCFMLGCATAPERRFTQMAQEARNEGFSEVRFGDSPALLGIMRGQQGAGRLWVVIEGDGMAWLSVREPSPDPTPSDPVGWRLARRVSEAAVLYLARPCQFLQVSERGDCTSLDWTDNRFSQRWIVRLDAAIDEAKRNAGMTNDARVVLAGYSGGGVLAALLAARRSDVSGLVTVAAPLDHAAWTSHHGVSALAGSLSLVEVQQRLATVPQMHVTGENDAVVPPFLIERFVAAYPAGAPVTVLKLPGVDHAMRTDIDLSRLRTSTLPGPTVGGRQTFP